MIFKTNGGLLNAKKNVTAQSPGTAFQMAIYWNDGMEK